MMRVFKKAFEMVLPSGCEGLSRQVAYGRSRGRSISCHYLGLFVRHDGLVFPCCSVRNVDSLSICHVDDPNIEEQIRAYDRRCSCEAFKLIKGQHDQELQYQLLNIEVSLACQGDCAMCSVDAPSWRGIYQYYQSLTKLVGLTRPDIILIQGGEVLIQQKTLQWVSDLSASYPDSERYLVTNGSVDAGMINRTEQLFDRVYISFVGFQNETYKKVMGLDLDKSTAFAEALIKGGATQVYFKYLITPVNAHESEIFLLWALSVGGKRISFSGAANSKYINYETADNYWRKIFDRTSRGVKNVILSNKDLIRREQIKIAFDSEVMKLFRIDETFISENELNGSVLNRSEARLFLPESKNGYHSWCTE